MRSLITTGDRCEDVILLDFLGGSSVSEVDTLEGTAGCIGSERKIAKSLALSFLLMICDSVGDLITVVSSLTRSQLMTYQR